MGNWGTHIFLRSVLQNMFDVGLVLHEVCEACVETGIGCLTGTHSIFETKVGVEGEYKEIQKSKEKSILFKRNSVYHTHLSDGSTLSQSSGRLTPGIGHAGHVIVRSPRFVSSTPFSRFPRPALFIILWWRNCRTMRMNPL
jgi:hypothetical protein